MAFVATIGLMALVLVTLVLSTMIECSLSLSDESTTEASIKSCAIVQMRSGDFCANQKRQSNYAFNQGSKFEASQIKTNAVDSMASRNIQSEESEEDEVDIGGRFSFYVSDYDWFISASGESIMDMQQYLVTFSEEAFIIAQEAIDEAIADIGGSGMFIAFIPSSSYHLLLPQSKVSQFADNLKARMNDKFDITTENEAVDLRSHFFINRLEEDMKIAPEILNIKEKQTLLSVDEREEYNRNKLNARMLFETKNVTQLQELEFDDGLNIGDDNLRSKIILPSVENIASDNESRIGIMITVVETSESGLSYYAPSEETRVGFQVVVSEIQRCITDFLQNVEYLDNFVLESTTEDGLISLFLPIMNDFGYENDLLSITYALASLPFLIWIEPMMNVLINNVEATTIVQSGKTYPVLSNKPIWRAGITGKNQIVGIGDTGVDVGMSDNQVFIINNLFKSWCIRCM